MVTEDLFLEVVWEDGKSPEEDSELLGIIEGLDQQYIDTFRHPIEDSLPYLTFFQAELLFQALYDAYRQFELKQVAICHLEGKEAVSEGEVFASPFIIDRNYQNLLLPLIKAIIMEPDFASYSYQEKREYFVNQIYPVYKSSLGILESALPLFPEEGEEVPLTNTYKVSRQVASKSPKVEGSKTTGVPSLKKVFFLLGLLGIVTLGSVGAVFISFSQLAKQSEQLNYLHKELQDTNQLLTSEHQVDVFNRYFLPNYYSGNKDSLIEFLSGGDAKYTIPKTGTLQSVILEQMTYDAETKEYQSTYVLAVKQEETVTSVRLTFNVKASETSKYGYVVTTEPIESSYIK
ncbi:hypothetical protein [Streptococcus suis]